MITADARELRIVSRSWSASLQRQLTVGGGRQHRALERDGVQVRARTVLRVQAGDPQQPDRDRSALAIDNVLGP